MNKNLNLLLFTGQKLLFREFREQRTCNHNTFYQRLCCRNVLTVWMRRQADLTGGNIGWWGNNLPVCLIVCVSLCVFHHRNQCGVMSLGLQQQTPLRLTSLLQLHLHPPSYQITRRASQRDVLLAHREPRFRKRGICLLYHGCSKWHRSRQMQTHAHARTCTHI